MDLVQSFAKEATYNLVGAMALKATGIENMISSDSNTITRNIKRGSAMALVNEGVETFASGSSKFTRMDWLGLSDDVLFNSIASVGIEQFRLAQVIDGFLPNIGNNDIDEALLTSVIFTSVNWAGTMADRQGLSVRRLGRLIAGRM